MASVNGNNAYLSFAGVNLSGYWTGEVDKGAENSTVEVTAGAGATHVMRAAGLNDNTFKFSVTHDDTDFQQYRTALPIGTKGDLIYGPEGNITGKPKFQCSMILKSISGPNATIAKDLQMYEIEFEGAAAPSATIEGGSTF